MLRSVAITGAFCALALTFAPQARAFNLDSDVPGLVPPLPKRIVRPQMPSDTIIDGWIEYRFTIAPDGHITDLERIDGLNPSYFGVTTRGALLSFEYKPATLNGVAVTWHNQHFRFEYLIARGKMPIAQPRFKAIIDRIQAQLDQKDYAGARAAALGELEHVREIPKYCALNILLANTELGLGRKGAAAEALENMTILPVYEFAGALRKLFTLEAELGRYKAANVAYSLLLRLQSEIESVDGQAWRAITPAESSKMVEIRRAVANRQPITVNGTLIGRSWAYTPVHRTLSLTNHDGSIERIVARCHLIESAEMPIEPDTKWTLPANGGECEVEFSGTDDSTFDIVEYADASATNQSPSDRMHGPTLSEDKKDVRAPTSNFVEPHFWTLEAPVNEATGAR